MKRLLLVLLAAFAVGCSSDSTGPGTGSPHKIPKVGSTFTSRLTLGTFDTTIVETIMVTGLRYDGKKNVMMTVDSQRVAFEDNGDISIPYGGEAQWMRIPIISKKDTVLAQYRQDFSGGSYVIQEDQLKFLGEKTQVINGKNYEALRFQLTESYKFYDEDNVLSFTDYRIFRLSWIQEIGFFGSLGFEVPNAQPMTQELIAFDLK